MKRFLLIGLVSLSACFAKAQVGDPESAFTGYEVTFLKPGQQPDMHVQSVLRSQPAWQSFLAEHGTWYVHFDEKSGMPHRAYGQPIPIAGGTPEETALNFINERLQGFDVPAEQLEYVSTPASAKHTWVNFKQVFEGMPVLGSRMTVKLDGDNRVIMFGADVYPNIEMEEVPYLDVLTAASMAASGINMQITEVSSESELFVLPIPSENGMEYRPVYEIRVKAMEGSVPAIYYTLVDAENGTVHYRQNEVMHIDGKCNHDHGKCAMPPLTVAGNITGEVQPTNPFGSPASVGMPHVKFVISGTTYYSNADGSFSFAVNGPVSSNYSLEGRWAKVQTNNNTPSFNSTLMEGESNTVTVDNGSNIKERSTYYHTNLIHDHMKLHLPDFTGMDFAIPANVDVTGDCNAFYDGSSINFFAFGNGCNATSLINDVVYHEYGHGINDKFYQNNGVNFSNGAMNEGYADFWAISLTGSPLLGVGFYIDTEDPLRRYDEDPKVYPVDIVGEVHSDGEIICGAWVTTHGLMGDNWELTMDLFVQAFPGLQANTFNGNEGVAYTDVLIDALQADDDDGDITNGTPNGNAIVEGFAIHGITLISNATLTHTPIEFAQAETTVDIGANLLLSFPFLSYLESVVLFYRTSSETEWQAADMTPLGGPNYAASLPAQPAGTIIAYHIAAQDINGIISNVLPKGARLEDPNIPYFVMVGFSLEGVHDCDLNEDFGQWETGVPGDNATTGQWELDFPIGSFSEPGDLSTAVAPYYEHTGGADGELCFLTGQSSSPTAALGENDVDGGKTTLQTPVMDFTGYTDPAITYWRWYINNPPTGANPGADWWEVFISDDGGNNWVQVEETKTSDGSWRRYAFKVTDYVDLTDEVMMQFIASDSIRPGEYLDGGSLVEAALDDFHVYDKTFGQSVEEINTQASLMLWPNPVQDAFNVQWQLKTSSKVTVEVLNGLGQSVYIRDLGTLPSGEHRITVNVQSFAEGVYLLRVRTEGKEFVQRLVVKD